MLTRCFCALALLATPALAQTTIAGDSLVLTGTEPGGLLYGEVVPESVTVRSAYAPEAAETVYEEGVDYTVDYAAGTVARTEDSAMPNFEDNVLYDLEDFAHNEHPGYGNKPFTVYVDYKTEAYKLLAKAEDNRPLPKVAARLQAGEPLKIVAFGDSITAGGEASTVALRYQQRWAENLRAQYPEAEIMVENGATGGDTSRQGLERLEEKVLTQDPDLVIVAFGMNDHNINGVPLAEFEENLRTITERIREETGAEVLLLSTFPPNPKWRYGSDRMAQYTAVIEKVAADLETGYADLYAVWMRALERKDPQSLLANNINHPNDFGHWLYLQALLALNL